MAEATTEDLLDAATGRAIGLALAKAVTSLPPSERAEIYALAAVDGFHVHLYPSMATVTVGDREVWCGTYRETLPGRRAPGLN
jgi:hypothetical protein